MPPRYSGCIPRDLRDAYERAAADSDLLSLQDDFALLEARQISLLEALSEVPLPPWSAILAAEDLEAVKVMAREGLASQLVQTQMWAELREIIQEKAKVSTAESRRLETLSMMMSKEQALKLVGALVEAVTKHVVDESTLRSIKAEMGAIQLNS